MKNKTGIYIVVVSIIAEIICLGNIKLQLENVRLKEEIKQMRSVEDEL